MSVIYADDEPFEWEEYARWMYDDDAYYEPEEDVDPDLYDQYEYMLDHQDDE